MDHTQKFELESHLSSGINPELPSLGHTSATMIHLVPYEIWDIIIHNVVSEYTDTTLGGNALKSTVLLPRWYLVPLLRVCKACYPLAEKYLYQSISIGSKFLHRISHIEGEPLDEGLPCVQESSKPIVNRNEREIAEDLLATLEMNARLAGLVEELNLGMETQEVIKTPECTKTHIRILQLCPNLEHVGIRDFHQNEATAVLAALKEKMLISFYIYSQSITLQILELMQNWPKLKRIEVRGAWWTGVPSPTPSIFKATRFSTLCPKLQTLIFDDERITGSATLDALCDCFNAWSTTLTCLKLNIKRDQAAHLRINKAFSSLKCLRGLHVLGMDLDISFLSDLPHLRCLTFAHVNAKVSPVESLVNCLEQTDKFPALILVRIPVCPREVGRRVKDACSRRNIRSQIGSGSIIL